MKRMLRSLLMPAAVLTVVCLSPCGSWAAGSQSAPPPAKNQVFAKGLAAKELKITQGMSPEAAKCVECHARKTPGIVASWKESRMADAGVSCYDCHVVEKSSPMASQCPGTKGTDVYTSPMVSSKTCAKCHPVEVKQFLESGHGKLAGDPIIEKAKFQKLMYDVEGGALGGSDVIRSLRGHGFERILTEGGPRLMAELFRAGVVDELFLSVSPVLAGGGELGAEHATIAPEVAFLPDEPVPGVLRSARRRGSFLFLRYGLGDGAAV